jgi:hypothetical protein
MVAHHLLVALVPVLSLATPASPLSATQVAVAVVLAPVQWPTFCLVLAVEQAASLTLSLLAQHQLMPMLSGPQVLQVLLGPAANQAGLVVLV